MSAAVNRKRRPVIPKAAPTRRLEPLERWYLEQLTDFTAQRATQGMTDPPSLLTFANYISRSTTPAYQMLCRLEALGYLARDDRRRFVPRPGALRAAGA